MSPSIHLPLLLFAIATATVAAAKEFHVGGLVGWRIPASNETDLYTTWASRRRFHIGDSLRFRYNDDSVVAVDKWGYYHCDSSHPDSYSTDGDTLLTLDKVGMAYFISGSFERCQQGEKMMVLVRNVRRHFPPFKAEPPHNPFGEISPSPSDHQVYGTGPLLESGSAVLVLASASVAGRFVALAGLGLCLVQK